MRIFYTILKNSNITINESVRWFHEFLKNNNNIKEELKKKDDNYWDMLTNDTILENDQKEETKVEDTYEHIICEMKTGSGKSLTLLSSIVYWLYKHKFNLFLINKKVEINDNEPKWVKERIVEKLLLKYKNKLETENEKRKKDDEIINNYFHISDNKITLKDVFIEKKNAELKKQEYIENSDIEDNEDAISDISIEEQSKKQIFICSRTQSQLNQYFEELKKIENKIKNKISINMILIGSRKHLCINDVFLRKHKGVNDLNDCCKSSHCKYKTIFNEKSAEIMRKKNKKKIYYESCSSSNDNSSSDNDNLKENEENEKKEKIDNYMLVTKLINRKNINMNEIKEICKHEKIEICPYYLNKENIKNADIVLLPYVCILNENIRTSLKINITNNIVIFDESQNIVDYINDSNSASMEFYKIYFCKLILQEYIKKYKSVLNNNNLVMIKQIIIYCNLLLNVFKEFEKDNNINLVDDYANFSKNRNSEKNRECDSHVLKYDNFPIDTDMKRKGTYSSKIMNVNKFNILSKIDALNLNSLSIFLNNSMFCRRIRIFAESFLYKHFKNLKNEPNFNTTSLTTSIYALTEFTSKLIQANKYDYVFLNEVKEDNKSDDENIEANKIQKIGINKAQQNKKEDVHLKSRKRMSNLPNIINKEKKPKKEIDENRGNKDATVKMILKETEKDESMLLFENMFNHILNKNKEMFKKIEIISVSSCNNFQKIIKNCKNVILIGGTLYPIEEYLFLFLNENKNKVKVFSADYIFKQEHVFSRIINKSIVSNDLIDNTFKNRYNKKHLLNLAVHIYILTIHTNYGNIVFFPSYKFLKVFFHFLHKEGNYILEKIKKRKEIFFETKNDNFILKAYTEKIKIIKEQDKSMRIKNGCVLFCVMNAKLSEGINFHDEYCRNIIVVGLPFFKYDNKESNQYILDRNALTLEYYKNYSKEVIKEGKSMSLLKTEDVNTMCKTYQIKYAMKIVNQCIGRSMRHFNDFSSFFFLDYRFAKNEIYQNFPSFIKRHIDNIKEITVDINDSLFYKLKEDFKDIYEDLKNYYFKKNDQLKFEEVDNNQLNMFVKDLYSLILFHKKMDNI